MNYVARINLKTGTSYRDELIDFCLKENNSIWLLVGVEYMVREKY